MQAFFRSYKSCNGANHELIGQRVNSFQPAFEVILVLKWNIPDRFRCGAILYSLGAMLYSLSYFPLYRCPVWTRLEKKIKYWRFVCSGEMFGVENFVRMRVCRLRKTFDFSPLAAWYQFSDAPCIFSVNTKLLFLKHWSSCDFFGVVWGVAFMFLLFRSLSAGQVSAVH